MTTANGTRPREVTSTHVGRYAGPVSSRSRPHWHAAGTAEGHKRTLNYRISIIVRKRIAQRCCTWPKILYSPRWRRRARSTFFACFHANLRVHFDSTCESQGTIFRHAKNMRNSGSKKRTNSKHANFRVQFSDMRKYAKINIILRGASGRAQTCEICEIQGKKRSNFKHANFSHPNPDMRISGLPF